MDEKMDYLVVWLTSFAGKVARFLGMPHSQTPWVIWGLKTSSASFSWVSCRSAWVLHSVSLCGGTAVLIVPVCAVKCGHVLNCIYILIIYAYPYHKKWCKPNYEPICWALLFNTTKKVNLQFGVNWRWLTSVFATLHHLICPGDCAWQWQISHCCWFWSKVISLKSYDFPAMLNNFKNWMTANSTANPHLWR